MALLNGLFAGDMARLREQVQQVGPEGRAACIARPPPAKAWDRSLAVSHHCGGITAVARGRPASRRPHAGAVVYTRGGGRICAYLRHMCCSRVGVGCVMQNCDRLCLAGALGGGLGPQRAHERCTHFEHLECVLQPFSPVRGGKNATREVDRKDR
eukprot:5925438-Prymnesium_polylepis.1